MDSAAFLAQGVFSSVSVPVQLMPPRGEVSDHKSADESADERAHVRSTRGNPSVNDDSRAADDDRGEPSDPRNLPRTRGGIKHWQKKERAALTAHARGEPFRLELQGKYPPRFPQGLVETVGQIGSAISQSIGVLREELQESRQERATFLEMLKAEREASLQERTQFTALLRDVRGKRECLRSPDDPPSRCSKDSKPEEHAHVHPAKRGRRMARRGNSRSRSPSVSQPRRSSGAASPAERGRSIARRGQSRSRSVVQPRRRSGAASGAGFGAASSQQAVVKAKARPEKDKKQDPEKDKSEFVQSVMRTKSPEYPRGDAEKIWHDDEHKEMTVEKFRLWSYMTVCHILPVDFLHDWQQHYAKDKVMVYFLLKLAWLIDEERTTDVHESLDKYHDMSVIVTHLRHVGPDKLDFACHLNGFRMSKKKKLIVDTDTLVQHSVPMSALRPMKVDEAATWYRRWNTLNDAVKGFCSSTFRIFVVVGIPESTHRLFTTA